jgi:nucleoside-diphosphate-sugar epimerase
MNTIFITGGEGFIGNHLTGELLKSGERVIVFDNFSARQDREGRWRRAERPKVYSRKIIVRGDIRDRGRLKEALQRYRPGVLIHLAALSDSNIALRSPDECWSINVEGLQSLFTALNGLPELKRFIFVSSSYVYGDFDYEPADETHPLNPRHIYGITKLHGERMTVQFCTQNNIGYTLVRPTAVYGLGSGLERVCCKMILDAFTRKEIILHNEGRPKLDFTHVDDLVRGLLKTLYDNNARNQVFNLSRGQARSLGELAELIRKNIPGVKLVVQSRGAGKPWRGALDISKARDRLNFDPRIDLEEGIPALISDLGRIKDEYDLSISAQH